MGSCAWQKPVATQREQHVPRGWQRAAVLAHADRTWLPNEPPAASQAPRGTLLASVPKASENEPAARLSFLEESLQL